VLEATAGEVLVYSEATPLSQALPDREHIASCRQQLASRYGLLMPSLSTAHIVSTGPSLWEKIWGLSLWRPPSWPTQTLDELTDWIVATSYEQLLALPLASQYEVEQAIIGITSYSSGVKVEEVQLRSSFVNDLGID